MRDLIERDKAIKAVDDLPNCYNGYSDAYDKAYIIGVLEEVPSAQPEITDEQAILHLHSTGWMQNHDREMYEGELRKQIEYNSEGYDSLIPCEDIISRQAAIDALMAILDKPNHAEFLYTDEICKVLNDLPSAQPEPQWIPFKTRPLTEEEKEDYPEWDCILDCRLPDDGQAILVSIPRKH